MFPMNFLRNLYLYLNTWGISVEGEESGIDLPRTTTIQYEPSGIKNPHYGTNYTIPSACLRNALRNHTHSSVHTFQNTGRTHWKPLANILLPNGAGLQ